MSVLAAEPRWGVEAGANPNSSESGTTTSDCSWNPNRQNLGDPRTRYSGKETLDASSLVHR